mgnify:CR=1 FL=1
MDVEIRMPDLATTADEIRIVRWLVEAGQSVRLGEPLLEIETDKATMEVESIAAGTLKTILAAEDDRVAVGQVIAIVEDRSRQAEPGAASLGALADAPHAPPPPPEGGLESEGPSIPPPGDPPRSIAAPATDSASASSSASRGRGKHITSSSGRSPSNTCPSRSVDSS